MEVQPHPRSPTDQPDRPPAHGGGGAEDQITFFLKFCDTFLYFLILKRNYPYKKNIQYEGVEMKTKSLIVGFIVALCFLSMPVIAKEGPCIKLDNPSATCGSVHLTWSTLDPTRPFHVYHSLGGCTNWVEIGSTNNFYYDDTNVVAGSDYCYKIESSGDCDSAQTGLTVPSCVPEFPTLAFPLIIIIGLLLTVVAVRRIR